MSKPYDYIPASREVPLFVFGDHASKHIPESYDNLGLSGEDLTRHIAWDIGTETVVRTLCAEIGCAGQVAGVSRLVIDLNRVLTMDTLIPEISDETIIPGNQNIDDEEWQRRVDTYYTPYHENLGRALDAMGFGMGISIHSFTPQLKGKSPRELEIGLLFKVDEPSAAAFKGELSKVRPDWRVAYNEPYSAFDLNHTIDANVSTRTLPHLSIEINQAMIDTDDKAVSVARDLAKALRPLISKIEDAKKNVLNGA